MTVADLILITLVSAVFMISVLVALYALDGMSEELYPMFGSTPARTALTTVRNVFGMFDVLIFFLFLMLSMLPIVFATLVKTHPIFIVFNIMLIIVYMLMTPMISKMMYSVFNTDELAQYAAGGGGSFTFRFTMALFQYLPLVSLGLSMVLMVSQFGKGRTP